MCARLTEAAKKAEEKAAQAKADAESAEGVADFRKARIKDMKRAIVVVLRAGEGFPRPPVIPHVAPRGTGGESRDRFAMVGLE